MESGISDTLNEYVKNAVLSALELSSAKLIAEGKQQQWLDEWSEEVFTCILGFSSEKMNGSLLLCCEKDFLEATSPGGGKSEVELSDWIGELGNLVVGRVKSSMLFHKVSLNMNPPSVSMAPASILESYAERNPSGPFWFEVDGKKICAQFGCTTVGVDFQDVVTSGEEIHAGGAIMDMNPVAKKPAQKKAQGESVKSACALFSSVMGVEVVEKGIKIGFSSGVSVLINNDLLAGEGREAINLGGERLEVEPSPKGVQVKYQGMAFFLPHSQAA